MDILKLCVCVAVGRPILIVQPVGVAPTNKDWAVKSWFAVPLDEVLTCFLYELKTWGISLCFSNAFFYHCWDFADFFLSSYLNNIWVSDILIFVRQMVYFLQGQSCSCCHLLYHCVNPVFNPSAPLPTPSPEQGPDLLTYHTWMWFVHSDIAISNYTYRNQERTHLLDPSACWRKSSPCLARLLPAIGMEVPQPSASI